YSALGGEVVAYALMLAGVVSVFALQSVAGLWYVIIGMFLRSTARRSYAEQMQDLVLRDVPARLLMLPPGEPVEAAMSVQELVDERGGSERFFLVRRDEVVVGLLTISDVVRTRRSEWDRTSLG